MPETIEELSAIIEYDLPESVDVALKNQKITVSIDKCLQELSAQHAVFIRVLVASNFDIDTAYNAVSRANTDKAAFINEVMTNPKALKSLNLLKKGRLAHVEDITSEYILDGLKEVAVRSLQEKPVLCKQTGKYLGEFTSDYNTAVKALKAMADVKGLTAKNNINITQNTLNVSIEERMQNSSQRMRQLIANNEAVEHEDSKLATNPYDGIPQEGETIIEALNDEKIETLEIPESLDSLFD